VQNACVRLPFLVFCAFAVLFATSTLACNEAPLLAAPDAGNPCLASIPIAPCVAGDAGAPGCGPDLDSGAALTREVVLPGASYPPGCQVVVYSPVPDLDRQCSQLGTCMCGGGGDAGPYEWACVQ
jgi:hypothetical protein